jgi:hypothetical protein
MALWSMAGLKSTCKLDLYDFNTSFEGSKSSPSLTMVIFPDRGYEYFYINGTKCYQKK